MAKKVIKNDLIELITKLDKQIIDKWNEYLQLHKELEPLRGKLLDDDNIKKANIVLENIQDKFAEIFPALNFIATRHPFVVNATNEHENFLNDLKKAGATEFKTKKEWENVRAGKTNPQ